ncbi:hypothetical protein ZWY2020_036134 [Hordeum vulgare]|nr:hypothetical protein ZWY2020_036134 [Hordeum vulgare]
MRTITERPLLFIPVRSRAGLVPLVPPLLLRPDRSRLRMEQQEVTNDEGPMKKTIRSGFYLAARADPLLLPPMREGKEEDLGFPGLMTGEES